MARRARSLFLLVDTVAPSLSFEPTKVDDFDEEISLDDDEKAQYLPVVLNLNQSRKMYQMPMRHSLFIIALPRGLSTSLSIF